MTLFQENDLRRFTGEPMKLHDFMSEFVVHCPKCDGTATIKVPSPYDNNNAVLRCNDCHFSEKISERTRFKTTGKAVCHECRTPLNPDIKDRKEIPSFVKVTCPNCKTINKIAENWESYIMKYNDSGIIDPAFGLHLWYQDKVRGNVIWAFNHAHLVEIRNYVAAQLRERPISKLKMMMVDKLPEFIKSAKNRDEVVDALDRMEKSVI